MQTTSALYNDIISDSNHWFEARLIIDGVGTFDETQLFSISTNIEMFQDTPTIGKAVAGEISIKMLKPSVNIPLMAKLQPQVRVCNATDQSEWLAQGIYYIDTRETTRNEDELDVLSIHGYDAMLRAEQMYNGRITGNSTDIRMVNEIAYQMGVSVDGRTADLMTNGYTIPLPTGYTYREVLGYIASMYVGCFIMSDVGELRLVGMTELPPETNYLITQTGDVITFGTGIETETLSGKIVSFSDGNGNDLDALSVAVEPVQAGSGDPSPDNVRPISGWDSVVVNRTGANMLDDAYSTSKTNVIVLSEGTYYAQAWLLENPSQHTTNPQILIDGVWTNITPPYSGDGISITGRSFGWLYSNATQTITVEAGKKCSIRYNRNNTAMQTRRLSFSTTELSTFEEYQGNQYTIQLGQTVYGGTLDVTAGTMTVNMALVEMGSVNWSKNTVTQGTLWRHTFGDMANAVSSVKSDILCSLYPTVPLTQRAEKTLSASSKNVDVIDSSYADAASFKTAVTGQQLVYPLATPFEISLTPTQIQTLVGENVVWSDAGAIELSYTTGGEVTRILV